MEHRDNPRIDGRLAQAVSHPVRIAFLRVLARRERLSPREALQELPGALKDLPEAQRRRVESTSIALSQVSYHVSVLERFGVVESAGRPDRQTGMPFRATDAGELLMLAIGTPPEGGRT